VNVSLSPNVVSALRFPLAAAFPLVPGVAAKLVIVAAAAATDFLDGRLARGRDRVTRRGELLDPIADKAFMLAALLTLAIGRGSPAWTIPLFLTRDIGVASGALLSLARGRRSWPARLPGKAVTWLQFLGIGVCLVWPATAPFAAAILAAAGLAALADYARAPRAPAR
jgi:CDP-diacylglycerol--glycerol-3-phosphate 3-phosphatidyltransferase/cardiolipin synthase